jgi:hypothetical protein
VENDTPRKIKYTDNVYKNKSIKYEFFRSYQMEFGIFFFGISSSVVVRLRSSRYCKRLSIKSGVGAGDDERFS